MVVPSTSRINHHILTSSKIQNFLKRLDSIDSDLIFPIPSVKEFMSELVNIRAAVELGSSDDSVLWDGIHANFWNGLSILNDSKL